MQLPKKYLNQKIVSLKSFLPTIKGRLKASGKQKIFCVGRNKTGTTSLACAMASLGYSVGRQRPAELQLRNWAQRDFRKLIAYCKTAEFFQDIPFSLPYTFQAMDVAFPRSKFILTIREDAETWHKSMVNFHLKPDVHGEKARSLNALKEAEYCYKGFAYDTKVLVYDFPADDPYDKQTLINHYNFHNRMVKDYFKNRKQDLLVLDVTKEGAYKELCEFIGESPLYDTFPWENRT